MKKINWRYAIGELLIVIVGITIAFALNNWAQSSKQEEISREYLANISSDLEKDISNLDSNIVEIENRIVFLKSLFPHFRAELPGRDSLGMKITQYFDPVVFRPMETTIQSMKFSGDLKLIKNLELKNSIIEHYNSYEKVEIEYDRHWNFAKEYLAPFYMKEMNYSTIRKEGFKYFSDNYFQNLVYSLYGIYSLELKAHKEVRDSAQRMKEMISL